MAFKLGMTVDLCMAYLLMLVSMTLIHSHSGSAKAKIQCWIIWTTKQATSIKLITVDHLLSNLDFENVYMAWPSGFVFFYRRVSSDVIVCFEFLLNVVSQLKTLLFVQFLCLYIFLMFFSFVNTHLIPKSQHSKLSAWVGTEVSSLGSDI